VWTVAEGVWALGGQLGALDCKVDDMWAWFFPTSGGRVMGLNDATRAYFLDTIGLTKQKMGRVDAWAPVDLYCWLSTTASRGHPPLTNKI